MTLYKDLLLRTGCGGIDSSQLAEQEACATIAIGLGGRGLHVLKILKGRYMEIFKRTTPMILNRFSAILGFLQWIQIDMH